MLPLCELCLETDFQRVAKGREEKWCLWSMGTRVRLIIACALDRGSKSGALPQCPKPWSRHEKNEEKNPKEGHSAH